ncbi:MAG: hypothetical protein WDZ94_02395 [Patescibacteria group bacterium]
MKYFVALILFITLFISLFNIADANITNNTVAIALMLLLLALFSDLKEFNFWGLSGKKTEETLRRLMLAPIINEEKEEKPSPYKLRKAVSEDSLEQLGGLKDNFLALSFELERQLRVIARSLTRSTEETAQLSPQAVLDTLEDEEFLTPEACDSIEQIREIRRSLTQPGGRVPTETLEASLKLAQNLYSRLREWLDSSGK